MSLKLSRKEIQERRNFTADILMFPLFQIMIMKYYTKKNQNQNQTGLKDFKPREKLSRKIIFTTIACNLAMMVANLPLSIRV